MWKRSIQEIHGVGAFIIKWFTTNLSIFKLSRQLFYNYNYERMNEVIVMNEEIHYSLSIHTITIFKSKISVFKNSTVISYVLS